MKVNGFEMLIGEQSKFLTITNTNRTGYVTFIESGGAKFDISEAEFVHFSDYCAKEALKIITATPKEQSTVSYIEHKDEEEVK